MNSLPEAGALHAVHVLETSAALDTTPAVIPRYLEATYWWAYVHPRAVRLFERQWLVNMILWGNFARLRDAAIAELEPGLGGRTLQIACVYGDLTPRLAARVPAGAQLDVVDVLPVQLRNLHAKLAPPAPVRTHLADSTALDFATGSFDQALVFFLLHEQPAEARRRTMAEALRVVRPGGRVVLVDYHKPRFWHPLRALMRLVLAALEPYALDLWETELADWLPSGFEARSVVTQTYFGGLYQKVVIEV
ncbi:MAG: class I SAM-dependent methyltransferase [Betaproteobacteria bacterium]|nr:class I SAM-dependent methyltransferase [Betaproteobacteria bacterium]